MYQYDKLPLGGEINTRHPCTSVMGPGASAEPEETSHDLDTSQLTETTHQHHDPPPASSCNNPASGIRHTRGFRKKNKGDHIQLSMWYIGA